MSFDACKRWGMVGLMALTTCGIGIHLALAAAQSQVEKKDEAPAVVQPGETNAQPPSDAVVLFDGKDISNFSGKDGQAGWKVTDGYMEVTPKTGSIWTNKEFGDCQLHIEFREPYPPTGEGQGCGNSGVYLQGRYEVQVLDSYTSETYHNGQCGAIYGNHAPLVNACRPPGQWQTYDIIFTAPRFDDQGNVTAKPRITVLHNGVLIQNYSDVKGPTSAAKFGDMKPTGPLVLQDHGNPVRYRNIWIRPLN